MKFPKCQNVPFVPHTLQTAEDFSPTLSLFHKKICEATQLHSSVIWITVSQYLVPATLVPPFPSLSLCLFCTSAFFVPYFVFAVMQFCAGSEVWSQRCEETGQVEQIEQCGHSLCLLYRPHQHLHHSAWIWGTGSQVGPDRTLTVHTLGTPTVVRWKHRATMSLFFLSRSVMTPAMSIADPQIPVLPIDLNVTGGL